MTHAVPMSVKAMTSGQLDNCPNPSDINWPDIYANAQPLSTSKTDKRLYGTVNAVQKKQWYKLDIPYATGL